MKIWKTHPPCHRHSSFFFFPDASLLWFLAFSFHIYFMPHNLQRFFSFHVRTFAFGPFFVLAFARVAFFAGEGDLGFFFS